MAGDTVTTIFGGDDSNFQAAARKVKESIDALGAKAGPMQFFKEAAAGAESLHTATEHARAGVDALKAALAPLIAMGAALTGVATIFDGIKRSIELAAKVETAEFHLGAVAGGADKATASIKRLHEIGDETATGFGKLAEGSIRLQEAGQSADQAAESMGKLQKIALNSGSDVEELGAIYARVLTKADVSSKDLVKLAMTGIPGMAEISQSFKAAEQNTAKWDLEIDKTIQAMNRLFEQTEKQTSSANSFGSKIGLMQASFSQWARAGGNAVGGLIKAIDGISEGGISKMSGTFGKEFTEGLQQIETETGLSGAALQHFMAEGKLGYEELIAASGRFREEQHKAADAKAEEQKLANQNALLAEQKGLLDKVRAAIETATKPGGIFGTVEAFFETFNGKWQQVQHAIDGAFHSFGDPLMESLKPALDAINTFFEGPAKASVKDWGTYLGGMVKDAIHGLQTGDWKPLQKDGETAFAAILKMASTGMDNLGLALNAVFTGPGMVKAIAALSKALIAVASAFGEAMMQAAASPMRKVEAFDIAVMPGVRNIVAARNKSDWDKFTPEQKQEFTDQGGGAKPSALEEVTGGNIAKDSDIIAKIKGFSGVIAKVNEASKDLADAVTGVVATVKDAGQKMAQRDEGQSGKNAEGKPTGMDQTTWDTFYKPLTPRAQPKAAPGEPAATSSEPAAATTTSPIASASAGTAADTAGAPGATFAGFQPPSPQPEHKEAERGSGKSSSSKTEKAGKDDPMPSDFKGKTQKERWADYDQQWKGWNERNPLGFTETDALKKGGEASIQSDVGNTPGSGLGVPESPGPGVSPAMPNSPAGGNIGSAPAAPATGGAAAAITAPVALILSKLDLLIGAIGKEAGFLEKVLS